MRGRACSRRRRPAARPTPGRQAAVAALAAGDAAGALALADRATNASRTADPELALLRVRALGRLAGPPTPSARPPPRVATARSTRPIAPCWRPRWPTRGWRRATSRGARGLAAGGARSDKQRAAGWLALYAGDLRAARLLLRRPPGSASRPTDDALASLTALTTLSRTRAESAPAPGRRLPRPRPWRHGARGLRVRGGRGRGARRGPAAARRGRPPPRHARRGRGPRRASGSGSSPARRRTRGGRGELAWARALAGRATGAGARARSNTSSSRTPRARLVPIARRELEALAGGS
jgi:hypothetical protein